MSRWPAPTRADHDEFCRVEGWRHVRDARGPTATQHLTYELDLADGRTLRTRVSHPPDRTTYGPSLWAHILGDQLDVGEATFRACVRDRVRPPRGAIPAPPENAIPVDVVLLPLHRVGLSQARSPR